MAYTEKQKTKIINDICKGIESGLSLRIVIQEVIISRDTFYIWIDADKSKKDQYARATTQRHDTIFEEILEIADRQGKDVTYDKDGREIINHNIVQRNRLQIDSRKWMLGKMNPKKYGEKLDITSDNKGLQQKLTDSDRNDIIKALKDEQGRV